MKTIFKILLIISFFTIFFQIAKAEDTLNPCWRLLYLHDPDHNSFNPDSVMLDTCTSTEEHNILYAYKWYYVILPPGALIVPWAPRDSLIYRKWRDIDISFTELRNDFQFIENKFGPFIMRKEYPDMIDQSYISSRSFYIKFEKYFNIDSVVYYLKLIKGLYDSFYDMRAVQLAGDVDDKENGQNQIIIKIFPNPTKGNLNIELSNNKFGLQIIEIYNEINKLIYQFSFIKLSENILISLDLSFLSNGIYFLRCDSLIKKFIISK